MNYERIYNAIIAKAKAENRKKYKGIYYEGHHIIPKCLGGEGKASDRNHFNIILLTAKEHYICHKLLVLIYPNNKKLQYALWCMINGSGTKKRYTLSGRIYSRLRESFIKFKSESSIGHIHSEETKKKISEAQKGKHVSDEFRKKCSNRTYSEETRKKMSDSAKLRPIRTDEYKKKMSETLKGRVISEETRKKMSNSHKVRLGILN
jgi:hypothetical protein